MRQREQDSGERDHRSLDPIGGLKAILPDRMIQLVRVLSEERGAHLVQYMIQTIILSAIIVHHSCLASGYLVG